MERQPRELEEQETMEEEWETWEMWEDAWERALETRRESVGGQYYSTPTIKDIDRLSEDAGKRALEKRQESIRGQRFPALTIKDIDRPPGDAWKGRSEKGQECVEEPQYSVPIKEIGRLPSPNKLQTAMKITITNHTTTEMRLKRTEGYNDNHEEENPQSIPGGYAMKCGYATVRGTCFFGLHFEWNSLLIYLYLQSTGGLYGLINNRVECKVSVDEDILDEHLAWSGTSASLMACGLEITLECSSGKQSDMKVDVRQVD